MRFRRVTSVEPFENPELYVATLRPVFQGKLDSGNHGCLFYVVLSGVPFWAFAWSSRRNNARNIAAAYLLERLKMHAETMEAELQAIIEGSTEGD